MNHLGFDNRDKMILDYQESLRTANLRITELERERDELRRQRDKALERRDEALEACRLAYRCLGPSPVRHTYGDELKAEEALERVIDQAKTKKR